MAIDTPARHIYTGNGNQRVFPIPTKIIGDDYIRIEIDSVYQSDRTKWDIVNNSVIFITAPLNGVTIDIQVATSEEALSVLGSSTSMDIVAESITNVNTVATNIVDINQIVDNLPKILLADDNATTATQQATIATTKASEASASANQALTSRNQAETFKNSASTSATTATTKANEASVSATSASTSATSATTSRNQAETFAQQAQASATSVDVNNIVHRTDNESIAGVKTFSSTIVGSISGNSATATKLATARTINGVSFDGTTDIVAPTNLDITAGTTAGPIVTSSTGTNATLPTASASASGVITTGNQTIAGVKTFTSSPIVPTPADGDDSTKVATTAFVKAKSEADSIGVNQTWQDVTASRSIGVTYTNTTGKPIQVIITNKASTTNVDFSFKINSVVRALFVITGQPTSNQFGSLTAIIPNGSTYSTASYNSSVLHSWHELR